MALQDKLNAFQVQFESSIPQAAVEAMHRATDELLATKQAERAAKIGDVAPSFSLADENGQPVQLAELLAKGPVVLTFYRGGWCAYCKMDLGAMQEAANEIRALGASIVSISPQTTTNNRKSKNDIGLSFSILSDVNGEVSNTYGLRFELQDYLVDTYKSFGVHLPKINGDESWTLPMPARFVIAQDGTIEYAEVNPDYTKRPDPSELLPVLERLQRIRA